MTALTIRQPLSPSQKGNIVLGSMVDHFVFCTPPPSKTRQCSKNVPLMTWGGVSAASVSTPQLLNEIHQAVAQRCTAEAQQGGCQQHSVQEAEGKAPQNPFYVQPISGGVQISAHPEGPKQLSKNVHTSLKSEGGVGLQQTFTLCPNFPPLHARPRTRANKHTPFL